MGFFFSLIALVFIGKSFWDQREFFQGIDIQSIGVTAVVGGLVYLLANFMLVVAWKIIQFYLGYFQQVNDAINLAP